MEISGVKGQPSESVKAATVGTDQSQCHGSIDWMRTVTIPSHMPTHAQYSPCLFFKLVSAVRQTASSRALLYADLLQLWLI